MLRHQWPKQGRIHHVRLYWSKCSISKIGGGFLTILGERSIGIRSTFYFYFALDFSYTSINIYRDLHCWEMRFGWVPKGGQQMWNFSINVKAQVLQDMKLNKKRDFYDF